MTRAGAASLLAGWLLACVPSGPPADLHLDISGMHCGACAEALTEALKGVEGVDRAQVSLEGECARIVVPAARAEALRPRLAAAVTDLGYGASWSARRCEVSDG
jgi:copper chaperone CopZ